MPLLITLLRLFAAACLVAAGLGFAPPVAAAEEAEAAVADVAAAGEAAAPDADEASSDEAAAKPTPRRPPGPREALMPDEQRQRAWAVRHLGLAARPPGQREPLANPRGVAELTAPLAAADAGPMLVITEAARGGALYGRVILLAGDAGAALDGTMGRLHRYLRDHGWNVLTLGLPVRAGQALPERQRQRYSDQQWLSALNQNADGADADEADGDEDAEIDADALALAVAEAETKAVAASPEPAAAEEPLQPAAPAPPWADQVRARLELALAEMGGGGDQRTVVVAQGAAGAVALDFARNSEVAVGMVWFDPQPAADVNLARPLAGAAADKGAVQMLVVAANTADQHWLAEAVADVRMVQMQTPRVAVALQADDNPTSRLVRGWLQRRVNRPD